MLPEMRKRNNENGYHSEIIRLFQLYRNTLKDFTWDGGMSVYEKEKSDINRYIGKINEIFKFHSKGKLTAFYKKANNLFQSKANTVSAQVYFPKQIIEENDYWFRVRRPEDDKRFDIGDLFHVPFDLRGKIGTERFSIPGYPCLYMASSLECARESIGSPGIAVASCLKNKKELTVYDFSFFPKERQDDKINLRKAIVSYPFKIAASIATITNKEHKDDKYREEYIIPQLLLHCVIRENVPQKIVGILYSSMKAIGDNGLAQDDYCKHLNLAVPAIFGLKRFCSILINTFSITKPEVVPFIYLDRDEIDGIEDNMKKKNFHTINNNS